LTPRSFTSWRAFGEIWRVKNFFRRSWDRIWNGPDEDYFHARHDGYMVFNKPKYLPGDTVKLKAFIVKKKNGKPLEEEARLILDSDKPRVLATLVPYAPGAYEYRFVLHDSLGMKLDAPAIRLPDFSKRYSGQGTPRHVFYRSLTSTTSF
jgi:hypothetical protein